MIATKYILDEIDNAINELMDKNPMYIIMSPSSYSLLKEELGVDIMDDILEYQNLKIALTMDTDDNVKVV